MVQFGVIYLLIIGFVQHCEPLLIYQSRQYPENGAMSLECAFNNIEESLGYTKLSISHFSFSSLKWFKIFPNGTEEEIKNNSTDSFLIFSPSSNFPFSVLMKRQLTKSDSGLFKCTSLNYPQLQKLFKISLKSPVLKVSSKKMKVNASYYDLYCNIEEGWPSPTIYWTKGNQQAANPIAIGNHLTVRESGLYHCHVDNSLTKPVTQSFTVDTPPQIINNTNFFLVDAFYNKIPSSLSTKKTSVGRRYELTCLVHAVKDIQIVWYKKNDMITNTYHGKYRIRQYSLGPKQIASTLKILGISLDDENPFTCEVRFLNMMASIKKKMFKFHLIVLPKKKKKRLTPIDDDSSEFESSGSGAGDVSQNNSPIQLLDY